MLSAISRSSGERLLNSASAIPARPFERLEAYDLYLRALARFHRFTEESLAEAVSLLQQALAIESTYAPAAAFVGFCRRQQRVQGWGPLSDQDVAAAVRLARQALETARDDPDTISQAAITLFMLANEPALAAAVIDRAVTLNPNAVSA